MARLQSACMEAPPNGHRKRSGRVAALLVQGSLFVALLGSTVGQRLAFKAVGYHLGPHPLFVLLSVSGAFVVIFGAICAAIVATTGGFQAETRTWRCLAAFAAIGSCNGLQGAGMIFANPSVPGFMQVLLQQAVVPFTLAIARLVCGASFSWQQYGGVLGIMVGIILQLMPSSSSHGAEGDAAVPFAAGWALVFLLAQAPVAAAAVLQEWVFSDIPVNVFHMMFWASAFQFLALLLVIPLGVPSVVALGDEFSKASLLCASEPAAGSALASCVVLMLLAQLSQALMVKHASAAFMVLCLCLAVPASAVAFTSPLLMGAHTERMRSMTLIALASVFGGIVCYRAGEGPKADEEAITPVSSKGEPLLSVPARRNSRVFTTISAGVGIIQSEYTNAAHAETPLWQESTLLDDVHASRRGSRRYSSLGATTCTSGHSSA